MIHPWQFVVQGTVMVRGQRSAPCKVEATRHTLFEINAAGNTTSGCAG